MSERRPRNRKDRLVPEGETVEVLGEGRSEKSGGKRARESARTYAAGMDINYAIRRDIIGGNAVLLTFEKSIRRPWRASWTFTGTFNSVSHAIVMIYVIPFPRDQRERCWQRSEMYTRKFTCVVSLSHARDPDMRFRSRNPAANRGRSRGNPRVCGTQKRKRKKKKTKKRKKRRKRNDPMAFSLSSRAAWSCV